jgi:hypothetical protein
MNDPIDYEAIRARVDQRIKERTRFLASLGMYVAINIMLWAMWFFSDGRSSTPWPLWVTIFWGIGIVRQGFRVFIGNRYMENMREREIQREIEREKVRLYGTEKEKNEKNKRGAVHLSDDGELVYEEDEQESTHSGKQ